MLLILLIFGLIELINGLFKRKTKCIVLPPSTNRDIMSTINVQHDSNEQEIRQHENVKLFLCYK